MSKLLYNKERIHKAGEPMLQRFSYPTLFVRESINAVAHTLIEAILLVVIDLTDHVQQYLDRKIPGRDIALSYLYWIPDSMFMVLPAAVLFATVFSIGALTRHAEVTAAKASGYRVMGLPEAAPRGYRGFSYRKKLSKERTKKGYLA